MPDYIDWIAEAFEESFAFEVGTMGYPFEIDGLYRVDVRFYSPGTYGFTFPSATENGGSFIAINADFENFYEFRPDLTNEDPDGLVRGAIRVTAAHEFKHAIQLNNNWTLSSTTAGWFELDATWIEDVVYDDINDFYNYIRGADSPFTEPGASLYGRPLYEDATWQHFLQDRFGLEFLLEIHRRRGEGDTRTQLKQFVFRDLVIEREDDWAALWADYAAYNYLTAERATASFGFDEAAAFPLAPTTAIESFPYASGTQSVRPWAMSFFELDNAERRWRGGLTVRFEADPAIEWGVAVVLQNATTTIIERLEITDTADSFAIAGHDVADFDRIAVLVGNGRTGITVQPANPFVLAVEGPIVVDVVPTSFGGVKARF